MALGRKTGGRDFVKGMPQPAGPGRPPMPPELKHVQAMSIDEGRSRMTLMSKLPLAELEAIAASKTSMAIDVCIATALIRGMRDGNLQSLNLIWDRLWGKPKETVENRNLNVNADLDNIPEEVIDGILRARNDNST
jgi:hypothetical protein